MKGTKLWQSPGSPIIQGRSRRQRPFWQPWSSGIAVSCVLVGFFGLALSAETGAVGLALSGVAGAFATAAAAFPGAFVLAAVGVWFTRRIGTRQPWIVATMFGLIGGLTSVWVLSASIVVGGTVLK